LPKENPWQADGGLKSLEGTDRNACASRAWKGGNMELGFGTAPFFMTVLFYSRLLLPYYLPGVC